ncbi:unnamed protein product [Phytophthora fragariaefolia]|uniref:Unnamed protein product n=1 Tax=Phytophthora fragariaefolia TaxID=1490495 RepID=A0A9W7D8V6_9STRA|nr:unnamed protein product [Phytophthora fragariaefolia]
MGQLSVAIPPSNYKKWVPNAIDLKRICLYLSGKVSVLTRIRTSVRQQMIEDVHSYSFGMGVEGLGGRYARYDQELLEAFGHCLPDDHSPRTQPSMKPSLTQYICINVNSVCSLY